MRITILPRLHIPGTPNYEAGNSPLLRLISENAAEEAQITAEYARLKEAGAKVCWYGREHQGGNDYMALGLEVELA